jgi:hypothetical protein
VGRGYINLKVWSLEFGVWSLGGKHRAMPYKKKNKIMINPVRA